MIKLAYPAYSLADAIDYLREHNYSIVKTITSEQLAKVTAVDPEHKKQIYQSVMVYLRQDKHEIIHLIHSNLGYIFFNHQDSLDRYQLNKPDFYFNISLEGSDRIYQHDEICFTQQGMTGWTATFDYVTIFDHFGLAGTDDYAPFVGFFIQV